MILGGFEGEGRLDDDDLGLPTIVFDKNNGGIFKGLADDCEGKLIKERNLFSSKRTWERYGSDLDIINKD